MKKLETKLKQLQSAHSLSIREKADMRSVLSEYTKLKPVRIKSTAVHSPFSFNIFWQHKLVSATLILVIFLTSGAGAVYASTDSLPGDTLYRVKEVTEDLHERILFSDDARAEFAELLTGRREQEMLRLQKLGKLDEAHSNIINRRIEKHRDRAERVLTRLELRSPQKVARIRAGIADKSLNIRNLRHRSMAPAFRSLMQEIDDIYNKQEKELKSIEDELKSLDESY